MSEDPFSRLAPFIQEYIYAHRWTELRPVQVEACRVLFETDAHLLLATGTASGKTEAAFLPVLTVLAEQLPASVGALYIGPTKALINDQFYRLSDLLAEADIPVWEWHGDVPQSYKAKLLKAPRGVLQTTPESLESLLINRGMHLASLLGDLRFIVIDEVHVFMASDRGRQVLCHLARLRRYLREEPRRIGLSATLGDYSLAETWLASGSTRPVITPNIVGAAPRLRLAVEHFFVATAHSKGAKDKKPAPAAGQAAAGQAAAGQAAAGQAAAGQAATGQGQGADSETQPTDDAGEYVRYVFEQSRGRKCVIFANSRGETEQIIASLRQIAAAERHPDVYHVHHGSIAAPLREAAETALRDANSPAIAAATITLELGVDIGQLERVIQLNAPGSVSSFLQRLGRSGRRGGPSEMLLVCQEAPASGQTTLPQQIPWNVLQAIAIIQLYLEERWIEPIQPPQYPFSLLYHQIMSTLVSQGELTAAALAQRVLTLPPFQHVSQDDLRVLLRHLLAIDHIQNTAEGGLIVGLTGEKVVRNFRFYAVFPDNEEFAVREETREIGSIVLPPPPGERFGLAGRTWETLEVDPKRRVVLVKRVKGIASAAWQGGAGGVVHSRVVERMRRVLCEEVEYSYLQPRARTRLEQARHAARAAALGDGHVFPLGGQSYCLLPWVGSLQYRTLERLLKTLDGDSAVTAVAGLSPYYATFKANTEDAAAVHRAIVALAAQDIDPESLLGPKEAPQMQKYDEFVPPSLLRKAFLADWLDIAGLQAALAAW